ncbi:FtsK/SpoIIIE family DNA translocase [Taibaiella chishuiensis]|uniref:S-DNA-T family DNA segregation ATPase FtsK/SpoIIIE n=1 Tax=Taibaiella chishuiensis TaxID=1434707 RepID=A0A2P8DCN9_9BACT|nr:DNA translocase FtsK [Taibaiella chishuiensis]PSK94937.1 S-DNA-T family DNA segregation ATPase FtsK/SpoIIIE [Taibaiella chishuiensis]
MAATKTKKAASNSPGKKASNAGQNSSMSAARKRNIRLALGFLCLLLGSFFTLSVISYCFTWQQDQHHLLSSRGLFNFLFHDKAPVENWCGRLGAAAAHILVYRGVGIASLLFTIWLGAWGVNLVYGRIVIPIFKWIRWMALGFLFVCPLFSFAFPQMAFPLGGALGNGLIEWTNGFAGKAGSLFMLITVFCFFAFIVFQWDIKPLLRRARKLIPARMPAVNPTGDAAMDDAPTAETASDNNDRFKGFRLDKQDMEAAPVLSETDEEAAMVTGSNNKLNRNGMAEPFVTEEEPEEEPWDGSNLEMTIVERSEPETPVSQPAATGKPGIHLELPQADELVINEPVAEDPAAMEEEPWEEEAYEEEVYEEEEATTDGMLDFEIRTVEEPTAVPAHGSHITVESGEPYDPSLDLPNYKFPTLDLLDETEQGAISLDREELEKNKNQIISTLRSFGIEIQRITATVGPTVTLYEIVPAEGVRISKIRNLEDDIALNLAALGIRIIAPIPGKGTIGIEVPNTNKQMVPMRTLLASEKFVNSKMSLPIALGKKIDNENYIVDLATMPHLLMAGATGQGKSVGINAILVSLLYKKHPSQLKFVMVDPKKVELSIYRLIEKHYLAMLPNEEEPIITDTKKVVNTVNALCIEMDNRYELLKDGGARNIKEYNEKFIKRRLNPNNGHKYLPFIVLVIDEFADLIMTAGKEVEMPIARLAQLARAVGIHIIIATQRPSVNVITGIIKANFPARMAFKVSAKVDSRTILDAGGADQLIGRGDMLVSHGSELLRLQCAFVDTPEVERIVEFIGNQKGYATAFELPEYEGAEDERAEKEMIDLSKRDKMFEECARLVVNSQSGSTSMLQRKFNLGYNRAGRIMDQLEAAGIVGPAAGSKPRDVLITTEYELEKHLETLF